MAALLKAMSAQTRAFNSLMARDREGADGDMLGLLPSSDIDSPQPSGVRGALQRERLRLALQTTPGVFSIAVQSNMRRRMGLPEGLAASTQPPDPQLHLERFGGYDRQKTLGLLAWLTAGLLRSLWSENSAAASGRASLLLVCLEQANLDSGSMDLAWLLTLEEEPPSQVFTRSQAPTTAMGKSFSPLASQRWTTVSMAYLKELDTLQSRRAEVGRQRRQPAATTQEDEGQQTGGRYRQRAKAKAKTADQ